MMDSANEQDHPTHDEALSLLTKVPGAIGNFVRIYPGIQTSDETEWLETWFRERTNKYFNEIAPSLGAWVTTRWPSSCGKVRLVAFQFRDEGGILRQTQCR